MAQAGEETIRSVFKFYDADGSGKVSAAEVHKALAQMGINLAPEQVNAVMAQYDFNQDGEWDFSEFYQFYIKVVANTQQTLTFEQEVQGVFNLLDGNKNGRVDTKELKAFFTQVGCPLTDEELGDLVRMYDTNNTGYLELPEFTNIYKDAKSRM